MTYLNFEQAINNNTAQIFEIISELDKNNDCGDFCNFSEYMIDNLDDMRGEFEIIIEYMTDDLLDYDEVNEKVEALLF